MNKHPFSQRLSALLLSMALLAGLSAPAALAAKKETNVIHITSQEDWETLAANCRLDSWSQDKVVVLDQDLELTGSPSIPTFGGTFDGQNHIISGFSLSDEGDHQGLFRYIQESGHVKDLCLRADIKPSDVSSTVGGIAGVNSGIVDGCTFQGTVSGATNVGGIVGVNGTTGQLVRCVNRSGLVCGEHNTGGVAGANYGTMIGCRSAAQVNNRESTVAPRPESVDWTDLNSTQNMPACTDTGGVVGYSNGTLKECANMGPVGYPHTGYNVGGVAGRQAGYMTGCTNSGLVQGRKDVGGIVGQMEPYTLLRYEEDTLQKLARELDNLTSIMGSTLDSTDITRQLLSGHITDLTGHTQAAREQISSLLDDMKDLGSGTIDTVNELGRRADQVLQQLKPVASDMESASSRVNSALDQLDEALDVAGDVDPAFSSAETHLRQALSDMDDAFHLLLNGAPIPPHLGSFEELERALTIIFSILKSLPEAGDRLSSAMGELDAALRNLGSAQATVSDAVEELRDAVNELSSGTSHITSALGNLRSIIEEQADLPQLELPKLDPSFHEKEDILRETLTAMNDKLESINQTANQGGDDLSLWLNRINDQFSSITNVLRTAREEQNTDTIVEDLSDKGLASTTQGKVHCCINTGTVEGDVNIGGVAGAMAIEYDFDPEDDIVDQGKRSANFRFITRVVLQGCINRGPVTARKDCVGGLAGRMDLGVAADCQSYGSVESTSGEYIGGISGYSRGVIRDCWSKCALSGSKRVGGIAGFGCDVRSCRSLIQIDGASSYIGAIVGEIDRGGTLTKNTFVSESLGGTDGISYQGKAAPLPYEEFIAQPGTPEEFKSLTLTFMAEDKVISRLNVPYGGQVQPDQIPKVPPHAGFYGTWSDFETDCVLFDAQVEANYDPLQTAIASSDGSVLAEGVFSPADKLTVSDGTASGENGTALHIQCDSPFTAIRVALPEGAKHGKLLLLQEGGSWKELKSTREGSFLRAELEGQDVQLCLVSHQANSSLTLCLVLLGGGAVTAGIILRKKKHKKAEKPKESEPAQVS